jgi:tRNA(Ile)-lysidine synthase
MEDSFLQFLRRYCPEKPPLLLGLSGGPDSIALFHLLLDAKYPFEAAHIDHGWRQESKEESTYLSQACRQAGIAFHLKRLSPPQEVSNLEERGREARLAFFQSVLAAQNLGGVLLAHHADDHAETVLKRLFEGASLPKLRGLLPKTEVSGVVLYRPLLKLRKGDILKWLEVRKITYITDPTNADPRFLRSRLRGDLIPSLSAHFGKEITSNLCRLGETAAELEEFLQELIAPYLSQIQTGLGQVSIDFHDAFPPSPFLGKAVVRAFFDHQGLSLSYPVLEAILLHLQKGSLHKALKIGHQDVLIHKKKLTLKQMSPPSKIIG